MSSFIVVEALGLVTFWGLGRIARGAQHLFGGSRSRKKSKGSRGGGPGAAAGSGAGAAAGADAEDPVRSA
jgi:hypothetical protein